MSDAAAEACRSTAGRGAAPRGGSAAATGPVASVSVHRDPRDALSAWRDLAARAPTTPYQTPDWVLPWIETLGRAAGVEPLIVVARDAAGQPLALLPLGLQRRGRLRVATFLGAKDSNFNMGLFAPGLVLPRAGLVALLRAAAAASGTRVDLCLFRNQPRAWQGTANPFLAFPHQPSPSFAYWSPLAPDGEAFLKGQLSRDSRKKLRQKANRLAALGAVEAFEARGPAALGEVLDAFVAQRTARNAAAGLGCDDIPALRRFLEGTAGEGGPVAIHALRCGGRIVATLAGIRHGGRFSGMLTSFADEPEIARCSPGELLLGEVMKGYCARGFAAFDLGIGEARYKASYCPQVEPLFDCLVPLTLPGRAAAGAERLRLQAKRAIKQSRWAWPLAQRLRRALAAVRDPRRRGEGSGGPAHEAGGLED